MQQVDISARIQTARVLGLSIDELLTIYRVQFPVMRQHEADTWYDQTGRIVFTPSKGLIGVGLPPTARKANLKAGIHYAIRPPESELLGCGEERTASIAPRPRDNLPGGPVQRTVEYRAPVIRPDREQDYRLAWAFFQQDPNEQAPP